MCGVSTSLRFPGQLNGFVVTTLIPPFNLADTIGAEIYESSE